VATIRDRYLMQQIPPEAYNLQGLWHKLRAIHGVKSAELWGGGTDATVEQWTAKCALQNAAYGSRSSFEVAADTPVEAVQELIMAVELYAAQRRMFKSNQQQSVQDQTPQQLDLFP